MHGSRSAREREGGGSRDESRGEESRQARWETAGVGLRRGGKSLFHVAIPHLLMRMFSVILQAGRESGTYC